MTATLNILTGVDGRIEQRLSTLNTGCPGIITAYDAATQKAEVQPAVKVAWLDEAGDRQEAPLPIITNVPVHFSGGTLWGWVHSVEVGDTCWLKFSQSAIDDWLTDGKLSPARADKRFGITDAVAEMGLRDFGHVRVPVEKGVMRLGAEDGPRMVIDLNTMTLRLDSPNAIEIVSQVSIAMEAPRMIFNGRYLNPVDTSDI